MKLQRMKFSCAKLAFKAKTQKHNATDPVDKQGYKKKYIVRKYQEIEAEDDIKQYRYEEDEASLEMSRSQFLDEQDRL